MGRLRMKKIVLLLGISTLAGCAASGTSGGFMREVPEDVVALAGPNQNLQAVKFVEEDGCYWYQHQGPVETTLLPLRSKRGRHICTQQSS